MINSYSTRQPCLLLEVHLEVHNVTLPPGNSLIFTNPYLLGYLVYEPEIMANKNQTPVPLIQCLGKGVDGLNIQMVRWLIQKQHVRLPKCQPSKNHPAPLPI
ncbi:hypothetical protein OIU84_008419 [Salix udensis]|uniref:Uncharacterized protein n=1 Tax=Salix udensis TaxID=889485 RepID=A0AAD6JQJ0_9ROSI|nr:hypothetical protein OIU84_008419 [Salix udensis]